MVVLSKSSSTLYKRIVAAQVSPLDSLEHVRWVSTGCLPPKSSCSGHDLVLVGPFDALGNDASISGLLRQVRAQLVQRVRRFELATVKRRAVADHNLRRVLVGHHHGGLGQLGANRAWVVWHQRLLSHAAVLVALLLERLPIHIDENTRNK